MKISKGARLLMLGVLLVVVDQVIKVLVKTNMSLGEVIPVFGDWFRLCFVENEGMAFGMTLGSKVFLSVIRIVAVSAIGWFIWQTVKQHGRTRYVVLLSLIAAGAAGNIFDSMFYGLIFSNSSPDYVSYFVPFGTGYADFLMGRVVDMFYFPLIHGTFPMWFPIWGGEPFTFFSPVFNFADASITVGVIAMLIFCRKDLESFNATVDKGLHREHSVSASSSADEKGGKQ